MMNRSVQLEPLQPEHDAATIQAWIQTYLRQHLQWWSDAVRLEWTPERIERHIDQQGLALRDWEELCNAHLNPKAHVVTARREDRLVGVVYAELGRDRYLKIPTGSVSWIYVAEETRGQGVGQALIRAAHDWMYDQGVLLREVHVTQTNRHAVQLYQACGYKVVDHRMLS